ncbi:MAG: fibronectin type III domain-containing protein, partial [Cohnella sp.]|nr:fibronectin type III domain-containing protein [Cohnella sp.]
MSSGFEPIDIIGTSPEGTRFAKVEFEIHAYEADANGTAYFDNVQLFYAWAPNDLRLTDRTETSISMAWDEPLYGSGYIYEVYQLTETGDVKLGETENTSFTWTDSTPPTPAKAVTAYWYYVKAKLYGESIQLSWPTNILHAATLKPDNTITIMPLGDSITMGYTPEIPSPGGYRGGLWELLQAKHSNVLFVGSLSNNPSSVANFDPNHEGHPGYTTKRISELVDSEIAVHAPDFVLLMAGTNDMWNSDNEAAPYMRVTLEKIAKRLPDTHVIVASIPNIYLDNQTIRDSIVQYNAELESLVGELKSAGMKISLFDMNTKLKESYFTYPGTDHFHPDANGYKVMAEVWNDVLDAVIATGDVLGRFPTAPVLNEPVLVNNTTVQLSWQAAEDNIGVDHYKIYMSDAEITSVTGSTYGIVPNLAPSREYHFSIGAVDKAGNETVGNAVTVKTPDLELPDLNPPSTPSDLQATGVTSNSVTLSWVPGADDVGVKEHRIRYGDQTVSVTNIVYGSDRMTYEITGLSPQTRYDFDARAVDHSGNESEGALLSVETTAAPPSGLRLTGKTATSVALAWDGKDGVKAYRIYQDGSRMAETDQTSFTVGTLTPGQTYKFQVTA